MADAKKPGGGKPPAKPAPSPAAAEAEYVFFALVGIVVIFIIVPAVVKFFGYGEVNYSVPTDIEATGAHLFNSFFEVFSSISIFICLLLAMALIYAKFKHNEVIEAYNASHGGGQKAALPEGVSSAQFQAAAPDPRWLEIERHMAMSSQSEWRVAILEADILLYDMLDQMGYPGDTIAEKLKAADPSSFTTIDEAWRAHKIRNVIAHEGAGYDLTREEADRAIRLFKKVFEEFYFI